MKSYRYTVSFYKEVMGDDGTSIGEDEYIVTGSASPVVPANVSGPSDTWYPSEGGEVEIESITLDGRDVSFDIFTPAELAEMEENLFNAMEDDDGYFYGPDPDREYERRRDRDMEDDR